MTNELEDWQLALLVEARRYEDPTIVEAQEADALRETHDLRKQAKDKDSPVVVERRVAEEHEKASALLESASGLDNWEVVDADKREDELDSLSAVKELLSDALKENHGLRSGVVESMSATSMVEQFRNEDDGEIELESLAQQPETGGTDGEESAVEAAGGDANADTDEEDADPVESLSASERSEVDDILHRADMMSDRTPKYAESLREKAAGIVGVESADDINVEAL